MWHWYVDNGVFKTQELSIEGDAYAQSIAVGTAARQGQAPIPIAAYGGTIYSTPGYYVYDEDAFVDVLRNDGTPLTYLDAQGVARTEFGFHRNAVVACDWAANGVRLASGSYDGTVKIWRVTDGALLGTVDLNVSLGPTYVRKVSLSPDGNHLLVTCGTDNQGGPSTGGVVSEWDITNPTTPINQFTLNLNGWDARYAPTGQSFALIESQGEGYNAGSYTVSLRNATDGSVLLGADGITPLSTVFQNTSYGVGSAGLTFSPDGKRLAAATSDFPLIGLFNVADLSLIGSTNSYAGVSSLAFTSDGTGLLCGWYAYGTAGGVILLNAGSTSTTVPVLSQVLWGISEANPAPSPLNAVFAVATDPSSAHIVTACLYTPGGVSDGTNLLLLSVTDGSLSQRYDQETGVDSPNEVNSISYSPDGRYIAYTRLDNCLVVAHNPYYVPLTLTGGSLTPTTVTGGATATATLTLNLPARFPGAQVQVTSSNPAVVPLPSSVTIGAGNTSATFPIATAKVTVVTPVTLTAVYVTSSGAKVTLTSVLTVTP